jgi:protein JSN1
VAQECGFVNFVEAADAIRARDDVLHRLGGRIGKGTGPNGSVRIGYGKTDSAPAAPGTASGYNTPGGRGGPTGGIGSPRTEPVTFESGPGTPGAEIGPTRALWVGSIPSSTTPSTLLSIFQPFGPIESARVLTNKNCGFVNFERVDDAVMARKMLNGRDVLGSENGVMRIGFAKVPTRNLDNYPGDPSNAGFAAAIEALAELKGASSVPMTAEQQVLSGGIENYRSNLVADLLAQQQRQAQNSAAAPTAVPGAPAMHMRTASSLGTSSSNSIVPSSDKGGVPLPSDMVPRPAVSDLQLLMRELSDGDDDVEADVASVSSFRPPATYYTTIPLVSEVSTSRRFDTSRLRELRKTIENGQCTQDSVDAIASDHMDAIVDLASDYIGNTVVQKLFERCSDRVKHIMLERIAPHLAMIGIHKNGTWAAQKIIDTAPAPEQVAIIAQNLRPYVPPLLLDQFGNYVVQCCLPWVGDKSDFIFDAMVDRCWEIAQGRFGARSMRACLENQYVSKRQRKRVAIAIILNSVPLATSPNGALLLTWLLDTSGLSGRYRLLAPRFSPYLGNLCTHKLASLTVLRIVCQKSEPGASRTILSALFDSPNDAVLEEVLTDQVHGSQFVTKVLASNCFDAEARARYVEQVKRIVLAHSLIGVPAYRKLVEDLGLPAGPAPGQIGGVGATPRTDLGLAPHLGPFLPTGATVPQQSRFAAPPVPASQQQEISAMLAQMQLQQAGMFSPSSALAQSGYMGGAGAERQMPYNAASGRGPAAENGANSSSSFPAHMRSPQSDAFNPWSNAASDWERSASTGLSPGQGGTPNSHLAPRFGTSPNGQHSSPGQQAAQSQPFGQMSRHPFLEQLGRGPFSMQ